MKRYKQILLTILVILMIIHVLGGNMILKKKLINV